ncbi:Uncharacterised protein [Enterobacter asburiae]|uniref:Uncharacterized protein n=1 Tax=Enterobacter asburiae TaxID=61645 RepID=A0A376FLW8_ENTAS|nr:Uncharacterised protein [Enterobacter asburiae]
MRFHVVLCWSVLISNFRDGFAIAPRGLIVRCTSACAFTTTVRALFTCFTASRLTQSDNQPMLSPVVPLKSWLSPSRGKVSSQNRDHVLLLWPAFNHIRRGWFGVDRKKSNLT